MHCQRAYGIVSISHYYSRDLLVLFSNCEDFFSKSLTETGQ